MVRVGQVRKPERWLGVALVLACCAACTRHIDVVGEAMAPTLRNGESVTTTPSVGRLERGDIVGFKYPRDESKSFVQRIVGLPGEQIQMVEGQVFVDGQALDENYVADGNRSKDTWGPFTLAEGQYFLMGDNRRNSSDSRTWGPVRRDAIWAKVVDR